MTDDERDDKRADASPLVGPRRVGIFEFVRQVRREISKITWPSWKETWLSTVMVFIMIGLMTIFMMLVELILQYGEMFLIGARKL